MGGDGELVRAAGGVVWRDGAAGVEVAVIHRPAYDDWTLPKGKCDHGEADEAAAVREVWEETGLRCRLGPELSMVRYVDQKGRPKQVRYWVMQPVEPEPGDSGFAPNDEVDEVGWLLVPDARARMTYDRDRGVLDDLTGVLSGR